MKQKTLQTAPKLKSGRDSTEVAAALDGMITEAESGLKKVVCTGLMIVAISEDLPHGQFQSWLELHLPHRSLRTCRAWKQLAMSVLEICGLQVRDCPFLKVATAATLSLPPLVEKKIDKVIEGKTARQLFLQFKEARETESGISTAHGGDRRPRNDDGTPINPGPRDKAKLALDKWADIIALLEQETRTGSWSLLPSEGPVSMRAIKDITIDLNRALSAAGIK
jgi:hypothetical protein